MDESDSADNASHLLATSTPPALPPSVEEAYRRKCIQLKQRTTEVEEANDAARLRLARLKRQVEKMRLERAFLLEQLAKRTSANVEDSDGSPSPPPTVSSPRSTSFPPPPIANRRLNDSSIPQPKEKPLRIKRGHRKPSMLAGLETSAGGSTTGGPANNSVNPQTHSPSSDAFSTQPGDKTNGINSVGPPNKPGTAFELYCDETRPALDSKDGDTSAADEELARGWKDLADSSRQEFQERADDQMAKYQKEKEAYDTNAASAADKGKEPDEAEMEVEPNDQRGVSVSVNAEETPTAQEQDNDVEMGNYYTDQGTPADKLDE